MQGPELGLLGDTRSSRVDMCGVVGVNGDPLVCTPLTVVVMVLLVTVSNNR